MSDTSTKNIEIIAEDIFFGMKLAKSDAEDILALALERDRYKKVLERIASNDFFLLSIDMRREAREVLEKGEVSE